MRAEVDDLPDLLTRAFPSGIPAGEAAFIEALPPDRRAVTLLRLETLLREEEGAGVPIANLAAAAGMARQNYFELRRRWRKERSARSLTPYANVVQRGAVERGGSAKALPIVVSLVEATDDFVAAAEIAKRVVREVGSVDFRTALRLVRRERQVRAIDPAYLAKNYGRTLLVDLSAVDVPLGPPAKGLALAAFVLDRASLLIAGAAAGAGHEMASLQGRALERAIVFLERERVDTPVGDRPTPIGLVVEIVVADGYNCDPSGIAGLAQQAGFDVADEGPRRFGRRVAGLLGFRLDTLKLLPGFTTSTQDGAGGNIKRAPISPGEADDLVLAAVWRHNKKRLAALRSASSEGLALVGSGEMTDALTTVAKALNLPFAS